MASIRGRYEYDDDDLTPGKKKEGGLHQNLFDEDGNLKGSARFIPDDEDDSAPYSGPVYIYVHDESPRRSKQQEEWDDFVRQVVRDLLIVAIERGTPHAKRFWQEKVRPAIQPRVNRVAQRRALRRQRRADKKPVVVEATFVEPSQEIATASKEFRANMTSSEAQARYLLALAARRFSDDQMDLLAKTDIREEEGFIELERALSELPPEQVAKMLEKFEANPSLLTGDALTGLGLIMGVERVDDGPLPLEKRRNF